MAPDPRPSMEFPLASSPHSPPDDNHPHPHTPTPVPMRARILPSSCPPPTLPSATRSRPPPPLSPPRARRGSPSSQPDPTPPPSVPPFKARRQTSPECSPHSSCKFQSAAADRLALPDGFESPPLSSPLGL